MNIAVFSGRITKELVLKKTSTDIPYVKFVLAVPRIKKDESDFISCVAWSKTAETMCEHLAKGSRIMARGRIETDVYEKDGKKIYTTECVVENFEFADTKKKGAEAKEEEFKDVAKEEELPWVF